MGLVASRGREGGWQDSCGQVTSFWHGVSAGKEDGNEPQRVSRSESQLREQSQARGSPAAPPHAAPGHRGAAAGHAGGEPRAAAEAAGAGGASRRSQSMWRGDRVPQCSELRVPRQGGEGA